MKNQPTQLEQPQLETRRLGIEDLDVVYAFETTHYYDSETPKDNCPAPFQRSDLEEALTAAGSECYGIYVGGELAAFYWIQIEEAYQAHQYKPAERSLYLADVVVAREFRTPDLRLGQQIMETVISRAEQEGVNLITLTVDPLNSVGVHIYSKHGFRGVYYIEDAFDEDDRHPEALQADRLWMVRDADAVELDSEPILVQSDDREQLLDLMNNQGYKITALKQVGDRNDYRVNLVELRRQGREA